MTDLAKQANESKEHLQIVEINGVKMEVDMRSAKVAVLDHFVVGDPVKILKKGRYSGDDYKVYHGTIIGFDQFKEAPTIIIAYLESDYSCSEIQFIYYNKHSEGVEIVRSNEGDLPSSQAEITRRLDKEIEEKKSQLKDLEAKKQYFLDYMGRLFTNKA